MMILQTLQNVAKGASAELARAQSKFDALDAEVQQVTRDTSRTPEFKRKAIDELRKPVLDALGAIVRSVDESAGIAAAQRKFWGDKQFVLSQQRFDADPAKDAVIRTATAAQMQALPGPLLTLTAESALDEGDLPLLWQCLLAGTMRSREDGWTGVNLDALDLPDQQAALDIIKQCAATAAKAHFVYAQASGNVLTGAAKLAAAHAMQPA